MKTFTVIKAAAIFICVIAITGLTRPTPVRADDSGVLDIILPPTEVTAPDQLKVSDQTFAFTLLADGLPHTSGDFTTTALTEGSGRDAHYHITVTGFKKGGGGLAYNPWLNTINTAVGSFTAHAFAPPPAGHVFLFNLTKPYGYKITFKQVSSAAVDSYASYLLSNNNGNTNLAYVGDPSCVSGTTGQYLCAKSSISFTSPELGVTGPQYLLQSFKLKSPGQVVINGSVAAPGTLSGFSFDNAAKAIAIGGSIPNSLSGANKQVADYINQSSTKFSWDNVKGQLTDNFNKRTSGAPFAGNTSTGQWNLNSSTNDPANATASSFSTPPEGKLWNVDRSLVFNGVTTFNGSGTIAVNGDVVFNGDIVCTNNTRVGIIASGKITFKSSSIGCGGYTALGGNIAFDNNVSTNQTAHGIFVARDSIDLPSLNPVVTLHVNYDSYFSAHPTTLYQEILNVIFSTDS